MAKNRSAYAGSRFSVAGTTPSFRAFNNPGRSAEHFMAFQTPADANSIHELRTESMCMHVKRRARRRRTPFCEESGLPSLWNHSGRNILVSTWTMSALATHH